MNKRWYDLDPTVSMAISLLQNTLPEYRELAVNYLEARVRQLNPEAASHVEPKQNNHWLLGVVQKRQRMNEKSWQVIESMRYLEESDRKKLAAGLINYVYHLEHDMLVPGMNDKHMEESLEFVL